MSDFAQPKMLAAAGIAVTAAAAGTYFWYRSKFNSEVPPTKWRHVGTLDEINIYPVKSLARIELDSAKCQNLGVQLKELDYVDRRFMLVDTDRKLVTARTYPKMVKIEPHISGNRLILIVSGMNDLEINFDFIKTGKLVKADLWDMDVEVLECGAEYDRWFSRYLLGADEGLKLVFYPHQIPSRSQVPKSFQNGIFTKNDTGTLQDVSSYMLINQASVDDLNKRLEKKIPATQFRGTFLIKTSGPAYEEDKWQWVKIGNDAIFRNIAPCYRCILPNIDPFTAERHPEGEPLKTLKTYRVWGASKSPRMGAQLGLRTPGIVTRGDEVYVNDD